MILSYHHIAEAPGHYTVSELDFAAQLAYLQEHHDIVSLDTYVRFLVQHGRSHPAHAVLTFDDAFQSVATHVLPAAEALRLPIAVFAATGFLGTSDGWNPPAVRVPILDAQTLREVSQHPLVTIGSHTVSHPSLARLDASAVQQELRDSKHALESLIGRPVDFLAYPFGQPYLDFNRAVEAAARAAGYRAALSTDFKNRNATADLFRLHRITVEAHHGLTGFAAAIRPGARRALKQRLKNWVARIRYA